MSMGGRKNSVTLRLNPCPASNPDAEDTSAAPRCGPRRNDWWRMACLMTHVVMVGEAIMQRLRQEKEGILAWFVRQAKQVHEMTPKTRQ